MNQLIKLNLQHNFLNNVIPNNYFNHLSKLQVLDLSDNVFSGSLHELSKLLSLHYLDIGDNFFTGQLPIFKSTDLTHLDLGPNMITDSFQSLGVSSIGTLYKLQYLDLKSYSKKNN